MSLTLDPDTGYLVADPQYHCTTPQEIHGAFVEDYPEGHRRHDIWEAYLQLLAAIGEGVPGEDVEQWVNGSFTTTKDTPHDVDVVSFVPLQCLIGLNRQEQDELRRLFRGGETHPGGLVDSYLVPAEQELHGEETAATADARDYWLGVFGSDRDGVPKGIAVVMVGDDDV